MCDAQLALIVRKLQDETNRIIKLPEVRERMSSLQLTPAGSTPEEFARSIRTDLERWNALAKSANIKPTD